ncbi:hypothetical protein HY031_00030 [Candidatus Gottesmanbacteria bacterium]|nr:hypothetical protein [Candidatus Gottesmanbacteria bacterium]
MTKYYKRAMKYFEKHPNTNSFIHVIGGIGIGFLLTYPLAGSHPVRWGIAFLVLSVLGHVWAATQ